MSAPILDEDYTEKEVVSKPLTQNIKTRVTLYLGIMIIGGTILLGFKVPLPHSLIFALIFMMHGLFLSIILETVRYFFRKRREKKTRVKEIRDPFWFEVLEGGFSIWLLIMVVVLINYYALN